MTKSSSADSSPKGVQRLLALVRKSQLETPSNLITDTSLGNETALVEFAKLANRKG